MESGKIPQPGLPELRRIRLLEAAIRLLLKYTMPDNEAARLAISEAKKLIEHEQ